MSEPVRVRSTFNRSMAVVVWTVAGLAVLTALWTDRENMLWVYPAAAAAGVLGWVALWRPHVEVSDAGIRLQNVTHRVLVPWHALIHVDTRRALTLLTPQGAFVAWSAPAPGLLSALNSNARTARREARAAGADVRNSDLVGSDSGNAAVVIREQWENRRERGDVELGVAAETPVRRQWEPALPLLGGLLVVVTLWTMVATA
ncbi:PH domain-containing protein [Microbacterium invictum]|uniref:Low molecular weight protein antigen 6 PH domain-containing protein n=1 Tax=Microbacterium invictum TaxID=515415 RepID=A0AA40VLE8_9MICO|nr:MULTISPECIES: PH domain-containing protein [Microbacterium]MBB4138752.1 hypothetical protein [Microbacterium invictum]